MKKIIRETKEEGIIQVTTADERWYIKSTENKKSGMPEYKFVPSVTWISSYYPKGIGFYKWLANKGWDESQAIKQAAGDKGSKVHYAIEDLISGKEVKMEDKYINPTIEKEEELTLEEYECLMSFSDWFNSVKPETLATEIVVFNDKLGYAGTVDYVCRIDGELYIIDFKTSQSVWPGHNIQISAYKHAVGEEWQGAKLGILQIGYRRNKNGWKFNEMEDKFDLFLAAKKIWEEECEGVEPKQKDYPLTLKLNICKKKKKLGRKPSKKNKKSKK